MKALIQRVTEASVTIDNEEISKIGAGFLILLGVAKGDDEEDARLLAEKIAKLRVFCDENGKMNRSVQDIGGEILVVSQFTLCANYSHGNRPDFLSAEAPERANALYEHFSALFQNNGIPTQNGRFGADMKIALVNDGPVTIDMESAVLRKSPK
ncbi:MAG: D-tyrosyl-tRNA(Tyr) deacylase [Clostridia bacterium]|nr:D-tyrosyl-tRNA(Tyr) deacylase [Clostridia bacterium]